jgi:hypothetical protein
VAGETLVSVCSSAHVAVSTGLYCSEPETISSFGHLSYTIVTVPPARRFIHELRGIRILGSSYTRSCISISPHAPKRRLAPVQSPNPKPHMLWCWIDIHSFYVLAHIVCVWSPDQASAVNTGEVLDRGIAALLGKRRGIPGIGAMRYSLQHTNS